MATWDVVLGMLPSGCCLWAKRRISVALNRASINGIELFQTIMIAREERCTECGRAFPKMSDPLVRVRSIADIPGQFGEVIPPMCTLNEPAAPSSTVQALAMVSAGLGYLAGCDAG